MAHQRYGSGRRRVVWTTRLATVSGAVVFSPVALAHGNMNAGAFYQGMATVFMHWDLLLFFVVAGLYTAQQSLRLRPWVGALLVFGIGAGFLASLPGLEMPRPSVVSGGAFALLGLLVAAQIARPAWPGVILAGGAALGGGLALGTAELASIPRPFLFIAGLVLAAGMTVFYIVAAVVRLPAGWPWIGVRVLGSWIAAIGMIVCAYAWLLI